MICREKVFLFMTFFIDFDPELMNSADFKTLILYLRSYGFFLQTLSR